MTAVLLARAAQGATLRAARRVALAPYRVGVAGVRKVVIKALIVPTVGAFGVGAAMGAGLGLLFAPSSGKELRTKLKSIVVKTREPG